MNIEQINDSKIKVTVNTEDQEKYGISYDTMNYTDINTRKFCENIIEKAKRELGFDSRNSRILFEARNGFQGDLTIIISKIPKSLSDESEYMYQILCYENLDDFFDSGKVFKPCLEQIVSSELYSLDNKFYLYIEMEGKPSTAKKLITSLFEYSNPVNIAFEYLKEHGKRMGEKDILASICNVS